MSDCTGFPIEFEPVLVDPETLSKAGKSYRNGVISRYPNAVCELIPLSKNYCVDLCVDAEIWLFFGFTPEHAWLEALQYCEDFHYGDGGVDND